MDRDAVSPPPGSRLKKYLKPAFLRVFLSRAAPLVDGGGTLCIYHENQPVLAAGALPEDLAWNAPDTLSAPLSYDNEALGAIVLHLPGLSQAPEACRSRHRELVSFLAFSLQGLIELESARRSIADETLNKYRELSLLHRAIPNLNNSLQLRDVTEALLQECLSRSIPADKGCIYLRDPSNGISKAVNAFGLSGQDLAQARRSLLFRDVVRRQKGEIINDLSADPRWNNEIPGLRALLIVPILSPQVCEGVVFLASTQPAPFDAGHLKHVSTLTSVAGIAISNAFNFEGVQVLMDALMMALAEAIDSRDPYTAGHSERVARLLTAFAQMVHEDERAFPETSYTEDELREIFYAGILHDVGKIGIREEVLTKNARLPGRLLEIIETRLELFGLANHYDWTTDFERIKQLNRAITPSREDLDFVSELGARVLHVRGKQVPLLKEDERRRLMLHYGNLTPEERMEIERHPAESRRILQHIPFPENYTRLLTIIGQHHERLDGSGYPGRLQGDEILLPSRMLSIVDIYDAITQERHYKAAATRQEALDILQAEADRGKLDPNLVTFFARNIAAIERTADSVRSIRGRPGEQPDPV